MKNTFLQHFGMTRDPFDRDIPADQLFESEGLRELDVRLRYLIDKQGMGLVTGEVGSGKTTAVRKVIESLHPGTHKPLYTTPSTVSTVDLLRCVAYGLGLDPQHNRVRLTNQIRQELERLVNGKRLRPVLVIDEVHLLRNEVLDDLRLLTNFRMDSLNVVTLLLVGQSEFHRKLHFSAHEAFAQRLALRYHLDGIKRGEVAAFLAHQLARAGVNIPLFADAACDALFQASKGTLRLLNLLAHHALMAAAIDRAKQADVDHVRRAVAETE
ncbi:MAG: AAA family ATPase [Myxococcota bacterium]|nr:AAA family ATPase [Myxococcota bacterium]